MMKERTPKLSLSTLFVLVLMAVVPLAAATGFSNFERARHLVLVGFASLALMTWGVGLVRHKRAQLASPGTMALGVAFVGVVALSLVWSGAPLFGVLSVVTWVGLAVVFWVLAVPVGRPPAFLDWATAVAAGTLGAGALGLYDFFGGTGLTPVWDPAGVVGGFDSLTAAAVYYALAIPILIGAVGLSRGVRRWFVSLGLLLGILHFGLVVDGLILAVVGGVMLGGELLMHLAGKAQIGRSAKLVALATVLAVAVAGVGLLAFERPTEPSGADDLPRISETGQFELEEAGSGGLNYWYFAADRTEALLDYRFRPYLNSVARGLWNKEPVLGHGAGGWWLMQTDVVDDSDPVVRAIFDRYPAFKSPHSDYSRVAVEQGALGLLLFMLFVAGLLTAILGSFRSASTNDESFRIRSWALATAVVIGMALMVVLPVLELISSGVLWAGCAALLVAHGARETEGQKWLSIRSFGAGSGAVRATVALLSVGVGLVIAWPAAQHGQSALDRGHADHLMLGTQFHQALDYYEDAYEAYPAHPEILFNIARIHYLIGDAEAGREAIDKAVEQRPYDARFLTHAAHVALLDHRTETGLKHGREAVRTGPNHMNAYEVYGGALQRRHRYRDAAELFKTALERDPPVAQAAKMRVRYAHLLGEQLDEPEESLEQYEKAMEQIPYGPERMLLADRIEELERRLERMRLEEEGKPIPPELHPKFDGHDHQHDHGPGHDHGPSPFDMHDDHGPGHDHGPSPFDMQ